MANTAKKIVKARIENGGRWDPCKIYVIYEGETEETYLRDFFGDEIDPNPDRMVGMTEDEAHNYVQRLDIAYLRS